MITSLIPSPAVHCALYDVHRQLGGAHAARNTIHRHSLCIMRRDKADEMLKPFRDKLAVEQGA